MLKTNLTLLRIIGILEGISYLVLLLVAMPLKYLSDVPGPMFSTGMTHGVLFVLYVFFVFIVTYQHKWNFKKCFLALLASVLPFGTFVAEKKLFRNS